jgi:hypothetical protein
MNWEEIVGLIAVPLRYLFGGAEENQETAKSENQWLNRDSAHAPPTYKPATLLLH